LILVARLTEQIHYHHFTQGSSFHDGCAKHCDFMTLLGWQCHTVSYG